MLPGFERDGAAKGRRGGRRHGISVGARACSLTGLQGCPQGRRRLEGRGRAAQRPGLDAAGAAQWEALSNPILDAADAAQREAVRQPDPHPRDRALLRAIRPVASHPPR